MNDKGACFQKFLRERSAAVLFQNFEPSKLKQQLIARAEISESMHLCISNPKNQVCALR